MNNNNPQNDTVWRLAPYSWAHAETLARELAMPFVVATILASRGFTDISEAEAFLASPNRVPDPFLFRDMEEVVRVLAVAIESRRRVVVHGDYDADGITATALLVRGLGSFGLEAEWYLPNRFAEGYGLSEHAVKTIAGEGPGLLVTVDCGVNYPEEVALARRLGLDVVVIDHHEPGPVVPDCPLIHPLTGDYPSKNLCGVGLAFKVLHGLHIGLRGAPRTEVPAELHEYLDLVAVGSIADLVPLLEENRYYVKEGLKLLTIGARPGFRALTQVGGCAGGVDSGAVAFRIAPRLNAAGRLQDASLPLELLLTEDERRAKEISEELHELNGERQQVEKRILVEAVAQAEALTDLPPVLVLSGADWHEGVVGIVASRMVERYHRPAILLSLHDGVAKGSGRSIGAYDLVSGLRACDEWLTVYGGHTMAVGLTLPEENIERFAASIQAHARGVLTANDFIPVYHADAILRGTDITSDTAAALAALSPFGSGNPRPRLLVMNAQVIQPEVTRTGEHLRCLVDVEGVRARAIGFGLGLWSGELRERSRRQILGLELRNREWQGTLRPEFVLERIGGPAEVREPQRPCLWSCPHHEMAGGAGAAGATPSEDMASIPVRQTAQATRTAAQGEAPSANSGHEDGSLAAIARVLATGESTLLLVCSVAQSLPELEVAVSVAEGAEERLECLSRCCAGAFYERLMGAQVVVGEWDAVLKEPRAAEARTHVVAVDPPYRAEHRALLKQLAGKGATVHVVYGERERRRTARLLKYLVHPRFAMVCLYRALAHGAQGPELHRAAAEMAWGEGRVALCAEDLERAWQVLAELGLDQPAKQAGKIEANSVPLYADAEAEYQECSRQCRIP